MTDTEKIQMVEATLDGTIEFCRKLIRAGLLWDDGDRGPDAGKDCDFHGFDDLRLAVGEDLAREITCGEMKRYRLSKEVNP